MDKTETITIRLSPDTKDLLKRAATLKQMSIPEYCLTILDEQAAKDIKELETNYAPLLKTLGVASLVALPLALAGPVAMAIASAAAITSATLIEAKKSDQKTSQLYKQKSREGQKS